jgi:hypothetical protein
MDITSLADGLTYCGKVSAVRQTYYIFEARDNFLILSFSASKPGAGNFNVVNKNAVKYVHARFEGQRHVTSNDVAERARRTRHAPNSLVAINILYVLVATGAARIERIGEHRKLFFRILKQNVDG